MKKIVLVAILFAAEISSGQNPLIKQWDKDLGGDDYDMLKAFRPTRDGGYILGGHSESDIGGDKSENAWGQFGSDDYWIVKVDSTGNKQWDRTFGGTDYEYLGDLCQAADGGYLVGGVSPSGINGNKTQPTWGQNDYWIVKTDSIGNIEWDKDYGGTNDDWLLSLQQTLDGGFILGGYSLSNISGLKSQNSWGIWDYWIIKIDSNGNKLWDKDFGASAYDKLFCIQQTFDGGYILGGFSNSSIGGDKTQGTFGDEDYWVVKVDSLGNKLWDKDFGGSDKDYLTTLRQTTDNGYILGGYSYSGISGSKSQNTWGGADYWLLKMDSLGNMQWDKEFGGTDDDMLYSLEQTSDGGYLLAGESESNISGDKTQDNLGGSDTWVVKIDSAGNMQWDRTLLTTVVTDRGFALQTKKGCYVMANCNDGISAGGDKSQDGWGGYDYWIIKFCDSLAFLSQFSSDNSICEKFCTNFFDQSINNPTSWQWSFPGGDPSFSNDKNPVNICYNTPGIFDVTLITSDGVSSDTLILYDYITVSPTPPIPTISMAGDILTCSAAYSYQWQFYSIDIPGATNQSYIATDTGLFSVVVADQNGCVNSETQFVVPTGIGIPLGDQSLEVFPNPCSDYLKVVLKNNSFKPAVVTITNVLGTIVKSEVVTGNEKSLLINTGILNNGIYFLTTQDKEKAAIIKFVVHH